MTVYYDLSIWISIFLFKTKIVSVLTHNCILRVNCSLTSGSILFFFVDTSSA